MISVIVNILLVILVLGVLILVHEFGHFIVAKISKVRVDEFAFGFGPRIIGKKIGETTYAINLLPFGGYVKILGEGGDEELISSGDESKKEVIEEMIEEDNDPRSFKNKPAWIRLLILLAGVTMNLIVSVIIFYVLLINAGFKWYLSPAVEDINLSFGTKTREQVTELIPFRIDTKKNAFPKGFPESGYIKSVDGKTFKFTEDFTSYIKSHKGSNIDIEACSGKDAANGENCNLYLTNVPKDSPLGIYSGYNYVIKVEYKGAERVFGGFVHGINQVGMLAYYLGDMINKAKSSGDYKPLASSVSSPIGLYVAVDVVKSSGGVSGIAELIASLGLTLFLMNLLPIPALDGGRVLLILIEIVRGKPLNKKIENIIIQGSFIVLMLFMLAIVLKDVIFFKDLQNMFK